MADHGTWLIVRFLHVNDDAEPVPLTVTAVFLLTNRRRHFWVIETLIPAAFICRTKIEINSNSSTWSPPPHPPPLLHPPCCHTTMSLSQIVMLPAAAAAAGVAPDRKQLSAAEEVDTMSLGIRRELDNGGHCVCVWGGEGGYMSILVELTVFEANAWNQLEKVKETAK